MHYQKHYQKHYEKPHSRHRHWDEDELLFRFGEHQKRQDLLQLLDDLLFLACTTGPVRLVEYKHEAEEQRKRDGESHFVGWSTRSSAIALVA